MLREDPRAEFSSTRVTEENARRSLDDLEVERVDTGLSDEGRYCGATIEYGKAGPDDVLMRVTAINRGPDPTTLTLLPQLLARNTWSWAKGPRPDLGPKTAPCSQCTTRCQRSPPRAEGAPE